MEIEAVLSVILVQDEVKSFLVIAGLVRIPCLCLWLDVLHQIRGHCRRCYCR